MSSNMCLGVSLRSERCTLWSYPSFRMKQCCCGHLECLYICLKLKQEFNLIQFKKYGVLRCVHLTRYLILFANDGGM